MNIVRVVPPLLALLLTAPAAAEQYLLDDGTSFIAAPIGEAHGVLTLLRADGEEVAIERERISAIDRSVKVPVEIARKAAGKRKRFVDQRRKAATKLLEKLGRAKESEREGYIRC